MDILNTNRLRISFVNQRRYWPTPWFIAQHYRSGDHGKPRYEHNFDLLLFGRGLHVKWRPDGK